MSDYGYYNRKHQFPCTRCNGAGWTEARLMLTMKEMDALIAAGLGDREPPIERQRCPDCQGQGGGKLK